MKKEETIKRFCFGAVKTLGREKQVSFALDNLTVKDFAENHEIEGFELFQNDSFCFAILDVTSELNHTDLRDKAKVYSKEGYGISDLSDEVKLLDRIFKKEVGTSHYGLKNENYKRTVMTLQIKNNPGLLKEYIEVHAKVWPQIIDNMNTMGIRDMEIYLLGHQAFLIMETDLCFNLEKEGERWSNLPEEQEWQYYVAKFQNVDSNNKVVEKWKEMQLVNKN